MRILMVCLCFIFFFFLYINSYCFIIYFFIEDNWEKGIVEKENRPNRNLKKINYRLNEISIFFKPLVSNIINKLK